MLSLHLRQNVAKSWQRDRRNAIKQFCACRTIVLKGGIFLQPLVKDRLPLSVGCREFLDGQYELTSFIGFAEIPAKRTETIRAKFMGAGIHG